MSLRGVGESGNEELSLGFNDAAACGMRCTEEENIVVMKRVGNALAKLLRACGVNFGHFVNI